jgi:hypothetical protein
MLDEIIGMFLSFFSLFLKETPRVSFREQIYETSDTEESGTYDINRWPSYINKEYENLHIDEEELSSLLVNQRLTVYSGHANASSRQRSYWESIRKSSWTSLCITFAIFPSTAFIIAFLYLDLNTTDLCQEWQYRNNTLPPSVKRFRVIGDSVEAVIINLWFPLTIIVLFGWKEFRRRFFSTFYVAFIFGETTVIYYLFLLAFDVYDTHMYYRYPTNVLFFAGIICCSIIMLRNIRRSDSSISYSNGHILVLVSIQFLVASIMTFAYRYAIVPYFNSIKQEQFKFMVAAIAPVSAIIPVVVCKHLALRQSSEVVHPGRSFVLLYFIRGGVVAIYRIMQADFKNIWLFIGLSLFSGFLKILKTATHRIRIKLWRYIISQLQRTVCCQRLNELPSNTPHYRRLKADLEIQDMLFEYSTLVLTQGYFVLYFVESFKVSLLSFFYESLKRLAIGIGIDFFFNCLSNFVQIHYYNIPIGRVWTKYWKRHLLANFIVVLVIVSYFSPVLLSILQARESETRKYAVRNCTLF